MGLSLETLEKDFSPELRDASTWLRAADGTVTIDCSPDQLLALCDYLLKRAKPAFTQMISITATDESIPGESEPDRVALRSGAKERFRVVYHAAAIADGKRQLLRIVCWLPDGASLPSVTRFWSGADWMERETYDMFGIPFEGHPDLKRILMPDGYDGYPLRKDFPLRGIEPDRLYRQWDREREA